MGLWVILSDLIDRIRKKRQFYDQTRLKSKYGEVLRLQLISVVAVGFERVVWQQVHILEVQLLS